MTSAAGGAGEIAADVGGVSGAADPTTQASARTRVAVEELAGVAVGLRSTVASSTS